MTIGRTAGEPRMLSHGVWRYIVFELQIFKAPACDYQNLAFLPVATR